MRWKYGMWSTARRSRTYITRAELERYVDSCSVTLTNERVGQAPLHPPSP